MKYKGYLGMVEFDNEAEIFSGEVIGLKDVITFQAKTVKELKKAFKDSVEDYLNFCKAEKRAPQKPYSGKFVVRVDPDLHSRLALKSAESGKSLNQLVVETLEKVI